MIATFLICRRLEGEDLRVIFDEDLMVIPTFVICRRLESDSYVPHLSKT